MAAQLHSDSKKMTLNDFYKQFERIDKDTSDKESFTIDKGLILALTYQLEELKKWEPEAHQVMTLLSLLPTFNYMDDITNYWQKIDAT